MEDGRRKVATGRGVKDADGLSEAQRRFVDLYDGNATATAKLVGYREPGASGAQLMKNPAVLAALENRSRREVRVGVLNRIERQQFWSETILNENVPMQHRLKASELLGRSEGDFIDRIDVTSKGKSLGELVLESVEAAKERRANEGAIEAEAVVKQIE